MTMIPALTLVYVVSSNYHDSLEEIFKVLPWLIYLGLTGAVFYLLTQINRFVTKEVFQRLLFHDELRMPTTTQLLWSDNTLSKILKVRLREKIKVDFQIDLMTLKKEKENEIDARKLTASAVSQIRNIMRQNELLLQHNIEYGFVRNSIGGCLVAFVFSVLLIGYGYYVGREPLCCMGIAFAVVYLLPLLASRVIIKCYGNYYAKVLFEQYLSEDLSRLRGGNA